MRCMAGEAKPEGSALFRRNRLAGLREKRYKWGIESAPEGVDVGDKVPASLNRNFPAHAVFNPFTPLRSLS